MKRFLLAAYISLPFYGVAYAAEPPATVVLPTDFANKLNTYLKTRPLGESLELYVELNNCVVVSQAQGGPSHGECPAVQKYFNDLKAKPAEVTPPKP